MAQNLNDELDMFAKQDKARVARALMMLFWKDRLRNPNFTVEVTPEDLKGFRECMAYLEVEPKIMIYRPQGLPAVEPQPARGNRRAVPGRSAQPPRNFVVIQMVDADGNAITPIENNQADFDRAQEALGLRAARDAAARLAAQLLADLQANVTSSATITEAAQALKLLAKA